MVNILILFIFV
jgi:hypothetical protein